MCEFVDRLEARGEVIGEAKERENGIRTAILAFRKLKATAEAAKDYIMEAYQLSADTAYDKVQLYWNS